MKLLNLFSLIREVGTINTLPLLLIIAAVGLLSFVLITSVGPFNQGLFQSLNPKPQSQAATTVNLVINSNPSGMQITYDGQTQTTPFYVQADSGTTHTLGTLTTQQSISAFQETSGAVLFEAENYRKNIARGHQWTLENSTQWGGFSGVGYLDALPDNGTEIPTNYEFTSPELLYDINFTHTGTYWIWTRGRGKNDAIAYAIHGGLDGLPLATANLMGSHSPYIWEWLSNRFDNQPRATLTITTPGVHTLSIWMDVDGFIFDKVYLTQDQNITYANAPDTYNKPEFPKVAGGNYNFNSWSDNGALTHQITVPPANTTYTATFASTTATTPTPSPSVAPSSTPCNGADINHNASVDLLDYSIVVSHFGQAVSVGTNGDTNNNGSVDLLDYSVVVSNFGKTGC
jgi:hypothetical protein